VKSETSIAISNLTVQLSKCRKQANWVWWMWLYYFFGKFEISSLACILFCIWSRL